MREQGHLSRRSIASALPLAALAGAAPLATAALAAHARADSTEVEAAAHRCRSTRQALTEALDAYERALPPPHHTLDMTNREWWGFTVAVERRLFDGKAPKRTINRAGTSAERYVATTETIKQDLRNCEPSDRRRRRLLYRMRRRARARAAKIESLEGSFGLDGLYGKLLDANRLLHEAAEELFREPATSMAGVVAQAKALSAYATSIDATYANKHAGLFGKALADGLQHVARAAS